MLCCRRVFSRMNFELAEDVINDLVACKPGMIEKVLLMLQVKIKRAEYARGRQNDKPEADQHQSSKYLCYISPCYSLTCGVNVFLFNL